jgi:hypothetical protein
MRVVGDQLIRTLLYEMPAASAPALASSCLSFRAAGFDFGVSTTRSSIESVISLFSDSVRPGNCFASCSLDVRRCGVWR